MPAMASSLMPSSATRAARVYTTAPPRREAEMSPPVEDSPIAMVSRRSFRRWATLAASSDMASIVAFSEWAARSANGRALDPLHVLLDHGFRPGMLRLGRTLVHRADPAHGTGDRVGKRILHRLGNDGGEFGR